ncbi:PDR/VanB family oxidoreductase [Mycolicibacterium komossense]|uniref:Oxidoreductase n=1 Tax=Mycolicibacterium komossense TaxID=1779 RepID=A0ABT3CF65_9MYCO|nr:PDR/VanB family oxidoreductase [Mycolicibacterium komossense]MCV7228128.1 oxidoreductase [Mycolicibacterium komossense]
MQDTIIERIDHTVDGVASLTLRADDGPLAPWEAGAHIDVQLPNWLTRQYSLCGDLDDREHYRIAVRQDPLSRGGSEYINLFLHKGQRLTVSLPRNHFRLEKAPSYLFVAGGIGITPILPMMQAATSAGVPATLLYVGKAHEAMPFATELRDRYSTGEQVILFETNHHQRPDFAAIAATLSPQTLVYCCGPESMLVDVERAFLARRTRIERFQPVAKTFGPNMSFQVFCAQSQRTVDVDADTSLLEALLDAGYPVGAGCREGVCGSCEVGVVDGQPDHRDDIGAPQGRMYACVSRSLTPRLTLDL